jgi:protein-disulfide isomerase
MKRSTIFAISAVFLLLVFVLATLAVKSGSAASEAKRALLVRPHSPVIGPPNAPVEIVEFLDPACETCRAFYPVVKDMMAAHPGRIRVVLRWAPFHRGSDQVVAALEAARRQGRLTPALESLLANQAGWVVNHVSNPALAWTYLEQAGVDVARARAEMGASEIGAGIAQDLADARALEVTKTPEFFVNGKPLPSFGMVQLRTLVDEALVATRGR